MEFASYSFWDKLLFTGAAAVNSRTFEPRRIERPFDEGKVIVEPPLDLQRFRVK
jgi:hypothetical protein